MKKHDFRAPLRVSALMLMLIQPFCGSAASFTATDSPKVKPVIPPAGPASSANATITPSTYKISEILAFKVGHIDDGDTPKPSDMLAENNEILITISNPKDFLLSRPTDKTELILYADGFPLKGMNTEYFTAISRQYLSDPTKRWPDSLAIPFVFNRDTTDKEAWNSMFKLTKWYKNTNKFEISLGWEGMFPLLVKAPGAPHKVIVTFYNRFSFTVFSILYGIVLAGFIFLCHRTGLIRDPDTVFNSKNGPFSLAQTQLAFWTVAVIGGFCYLWVLTGQADSLNTSILLLLGISGGTTGVASLIDYYKKTNLEKNLAATATVPDPNNPVSATAPPVVTPNTIKQHRSFFEDILSDGVNMSVQRTQTALWNLVLGLYFIWYVITNKSMPYFDNTLLVLAGVSSVLYVSSKGPKIRIPLHHLRVVR